MCFGVGWGVLSTGFGCCSVILGAFAGFWCVWFRLLLGGFRWFWCFGFLGYFGDLRGFWGFWGFTGLVFPVKLFVDLMFGLLWLGLGFVLLFRGVVLDCLLLIAYWLLIIGSYSYRFYIITLDLRCGDFGVELLF